MVGKVNCRKHESITNAKASCADLHSQQGIKGVLKDGWLLKLQVVGTLSGPSTIPMFI
jgi:hypothetical protein